MSPALSDMQEKTLTGRSLNNHKKHEETADVTDEKSQNSEVQHTNLL